MELGHGKQGDMKYYPVEPAGVSQGSPSPQRRQPSAFGRNDGGTFSLQLMKRAFQRRSGVGTFARLAAMLLSLMLAGLTVLGAETVGNTNGTPSATDPAQTYRDFLSNPPWIKKLAYRRDRNYELGAAARLPHLTRFATYEAAVQPNGYYRKHLKGAPLYDGTFLTNPLPVVPGRGISGASDSMFWRLWLDNAIVLVPRDSEPGASSNNWMRYFFRHEQIDLEAVLKLGLDRLAGASIRWTDTNHFAADAFRAIIPYGPLIKGLVKGEITGYTNGCPLVVECTFGLDQHKPQHTTVRYRYDADQTFPPYEIEVEDTDQLGQKTRHSIYIDELNTGIDPKAEHGYLPEMFRVEQIPFDVVQYSSNGVLYSVDVQGRMHPIDTTYHPLSSLDHSGSRMATTAALVLVASCVCGILLFFTRRKPR